MWPGGMPNWDGVPVMFGVAEVVPDSISGGLMRAHNARTGGPRLVGKETELRVPDRHLSQVLVGVSMT